MKKLLLIAILWEFGLAAAQTTVSPVLELASGSNLLFSNRNSNGFLLQPTYHLNMEAGVGIDNKRGLLLPTFGVMVDETRSKYSHTEIEKKFFVLYGSIGYEYYLDDKWSIGLKTSLGFGKINDWQLHGEESSGKKLSGKTMKEELQEMETGKTRIVSLYVNIGYHITPHIKLKTEIFFSSAHDMYDGGDWLYSDLREKTMGVTFSLQYIFLSK